ncbi:MAG: GIY-YIG nuclease family protein [Chloroflexia bacterium]|nr:GIY-YIG nuclease family protein [Chloroflexia bacterium]
MASFRRILYIGVTSDLQRRVTEHQQQVLPGFTTRYKVNRLVYVESTTDVWAALTREKELKGWCREKKITLIEGLNPKWLDLSLDWE